MLVNKIKPLCYVFLTSLLAGCFVWAQPGIVKAEPLSAETIQSRLQTIVTQPVETIDLAETLILISRHWDPELDPRPPMETLDRLTESVQSQLAPGLSPQSVVDVLRRVIHKEWGFRFTDQADARGMPRIPGELFLHGLLQSKRGYCMNLSLLYLILGERLNLPLFGVALPNHFFVRYQSSKKAINIETTEGGQNLPDRFYRMRFNVATNDPYFMRNLDKKQSLGAYFSNVGLVFYSASRPEEAVFYLELSTQINPQSIDALNNLGNIYSDLKHYDKAVTTYKQALKADPLRLATLFNLGTAYAEAGNRDQAIETFLQVIPLDPAFVPAHDALFRLYMEERNLYGALLHLQILDELQPGMLNTALEIGSIYLEMNEYPLALETFEQARKRHPSRPEVEERLAATYYRMGDYDKALTHYHALIQKAPNMVMAYLQTGWTYYMKGELDPAIKWTQRGLRLGGPVTGITALGWMNLGLFQTLKQHYEDAEAAYRRVLKLKDRVMVDTLLKDLQAAQRRFPDNPDLLYFDGWVRMESGQTETGKTLLKKFLSRQPRGALADRARALLGTQDIASPEQTPSTGKTSPDGDMVRIPAGSFIMGANDHGDDEYPEHKVYLDAYEIDRYEVTAAEFAKFLNTVPQTKKLYLNNDRGTLIFAKRYRPRPGLENFPINNVSWYGADAFCRWKRKRLPTEAEWERAARGTDGRQFPWGRAPITPERSRYFQTWTEEIKHHVMVPVDSMPEGRSPEGVHHLLGNVKEWVDDWYDQEYYKDENHKINPKGQIGGEFKVLKGGSWRDLRSFVYASFRNNSYPESAQDDYGFRCARSIPGTEAPKKFTGWREPGRPPAPVSYNETLKRTQP